MGTISGWVEAKCDSCDCRFSCYITNHIFVNTKVVGTCDKCMNEQTHDCYDEYQIGDNGLPLKVGKKVFK